MRMTVLALAAAPLLLALASCSDVSTGQVVGGVGGAAVGAQFGQGSGKVLTTAAGALLGTLAGGAVERKLGN